jgi:hypothetical protein
MSLDRSKLEKVVELQERALRARCPACAENGQDRKGEHLRIFSNNRFGCCVHAGDAEHRRRIYALAGDRNRAFKAIRVRSSVQPSVSAIVSGILGRLGQLPSTPSPIKPCSDSADASDGAREIENRSTDPRTPRTGGAKSDQTAFNFSRTARTGSILLTRVSSIDKENVKEFEPGVRSVREEIPQLPYLAQDGTLVIPFASPAKYHWWKNGMSIRDIRAELS